MLSHGLAIQRVLCVVCVLTLALGGFMLAWLVPIGQMPDEWLHWESGLVRYDSLFRVASRSVCSKQLDVPLYFGTERMRFDPRAKVQPGLYEAVAGLSSRCATEHLGYGHRLTYFGVAPAQLLAFGRTPEARSFTAFYLTRIFHGMGVTSLLVALLWRARRRVVPGLALTCAVFAAPIVWQQSFAVSSDPAVFVGTLACVHLLVWRPDWRWSLALLALVWSALATKVTYLPAFVGIALVPIVLSWRRGKPPPRSVLALPVAMAVLALVSHALITTVLSDQNPFPFPYPGVDTPAQIAFVESHPWHVIKALLPYAYRFVEVPLLGRTPLGWLDTVPEPSAIRVWMALLGFAALSDGLVLVGMLAAARGSIETEPGRSLSRISLASLLALASYAVTGALIGLSMYLVLTPVGGPEVVGVQMRYYVPVFILFLALPSVVLGSVGDASPDVSAPTRTQVGAGVVAAALALALISQTVYRILERYY